MSAIFKQAAATWHAARAEFEIVREAAFARAVNEIDGALLNARGRAKGIDPYSLFIGPEIRAQAYASEELIEHWARYPRPQWGRFERQYIEDMEAQWR